MRAGEGVKDRARKGDSEAESAANNLVILRINVTMKLTSQLFGPGFIYATAGVYGFLYQLGFPF